MRLRGALHLAVAETRRSRGTLLFCVVSIAIGVASLTAVRSLVLSLEAGIATQTRGVLGADLELSSSLPLEGGVGAELARSLRAAGAEEAALTRFNSMLRRDGSGSRLVEVRAVRGAYPFYGAIGTDPPGAWQRLATGPLLVVDPALLSAMGLRLGERVYLGELALTVAAAFRKTPGSPTAGFGLAPAVYMDGALVPRTGLVRQGSRTTHVRLYRVPPGFDVERWKREQWNRALDASISIRTFREAAASVQRFLRRLSYFLTLVGLITLLLGGLGIGSAMTVFVRRKLDSAAILRALGARPREVFAVYALVAGLVGLVGSALGVAAGALLPAILAEVTARLGSDFLPVAVEFRVSPVACLHGVLAGVAASLLFALLPVYRVAGVSPLRVLRKELGTGGAPRSLREIAVLTAIALATAGFVLALAAAETSSLPVASYFTAAVAGALLLLALAARLLMLLTRRLGRRVPAYTLRQGLANLHRPGNQTGSVITAVGMGVLLVASIYIVEASLQQSIAVERREELPNLFLVDIQPDQLPEVERMVRRSPARDLQVAPMISARISAVNGAPIDRSSVAQDAAQRSWEDRMRTREYFLSYRDHAVASEEITQGSFWSGRPAAQEASIDETLAENLGIAIGDTMTLDVQGVPVTARVTSFRRIHWRAMVPNSMILLSPGEIERAPRMYVASFRVPDTRQRQEVQEALVRQFPNLSVIDMTEAAATITFLLERIALVLRFLAVLTVVTGIIILGGAIASGRFARRRESTLLKVLGASRRDLRRILVAEYAALAAAGALCGWGLAELITRPALAYFFQAAPEVPYPALLAVAAGVVLLNVAVAALIGRGIARARPMEVLRED
jgi:putative ABC transport system permease protein